MAKPDSTKVRELGPEAQGGAGDTRDRFRGVYKPGGNPPPPSPLDAVEKWARNQLGKWKKGRKK